MTGDTKTQYVERVRELLEPELGVEDLDLLCSDLEEQLSTIQGKKVEKRLGTPKEFVDTYLASAGLETHPADDRQPGRIKRGKLTVEAWITARRASALGSLWLRYQGAWWLLRGWVILIMYQIIYRPQPTFKPFPVPNVNEFATTSFAVLVGVTVGSLLLARTTKWFSGRILNILISAFAAYTALVAAVNS